MDSRKILEQTGNRTVTHEKVEGTAKPLKFWIQEFSNFVAVKGKTNKKKRFTISINLYIYGQRL